MRLWEWFRRGAGPRVVETSDAPAPVREETVEAPRVGTYSFEPKPEAPPPDVAEVVRDKAAARPDRPGFRVACRGVEPLPVPSLFERLLEERAAAEAWMSSEPGRAVPHWSRVIELQPADVDAWYSYGHALFAAGRLADARFALERCIALAPEDALALAGLGLVLRQSGELEAAVERYGRAAELDPEPATLAALLEAQEAAGMADAAAETRVRLAAEGS